MTYLLQLIMLGKLTLKNCLVMLPMVTLKAEIGGLK
jgi:2,4-dienoyl-CoA reductase-like NADH-dependent reductase (Old Yellow Enzyme family)